MHNSPPEPPPGQPFTNRYSSPYRVQYDPQINSRGKPFLSETLVAETSASDEEECFVPRSQVCNAGEEIRANRGRYFKQPRSANGKVAYVVFSGHKVGVFYNWTATALAIDGLEYSGRVYKGYESYDAAHLAWEGFTGTGRLPVDVAAVLGTRSYPIPPISSPPVTPQRRVPAYSTPITVKYAASPSIPSPLTSSPNVVHEEAFRGDNDGFWVVLTGTDPGVHQGRKAGEMAFGQYANPSFLRAGTREEANQIFVDSYMGLLVARHMS